MEICDPIDDFKKIKQGYTPYGDIRRVRRKTLQVIGTPKSPIMYYVVEAACAFYPRMDV